MEKIEKVRKRDGREVDFAIQKIADAIYKAAQSVGGDDPHLAMDLAHHVELVLTQSKSVPGVEDIQDACEKVLIEEGHARTAKAYILHRHTRDLQRERRAIILGGEETSGKTDLGFTEQALKILERRYLLKDNRGIITENPKEMLIRVSENIAQADLLYGSKKEDVTATSEEFYSVLSNLEFLPNSPTLMNAGTGSEQLSACFVLPIEDTMQSIFGTLRSAALIHQRGSGTGFSFSRLRPRNDSVQRNLGVASGPVAFLKVYDSALDIIKQGGVRPGANMAVLRVDHPDILRFVESKRDRKSLKNFNISVAVTDRFMKAVEQDKEYFLRNPRTDKFVGKLRARDVFAVITQNAWKTGDPGLIFIDEINRRHPCKHLGEIETTNQCGEAPLLPNEGCALGSVDVSKFVVNKDVDWQRLGSVIGIGVHFLDNMIDQSKYLSKKIEDKTKKTRKFGLGVMGFADLLFALRIKYDSQEGLDFAHKLMAFFKDKVYGASENLAMLRGVPPGYTGSDHERQGRKMRNLACISLSPTGTRSILADCSAGIEPIFALAYTKTVLGTNKVITINKQFQNALEESGCNGAEILHKVAMYGSVQSIKEIPKQIRDVFVTAQDILPEWHIDMQATLQKYVDNSISKTINFPRVAAIRDVENVYLRAWKKKCKGITIYRDGSYEDQVMTIGDAY